MTFWHRDASAVRTVSAGLIATALILLAGGSLAQEPVRIGAEFQVNTSTAGLQRYPAAASDADGDIVVVWETSGDPPAAHARRLSSAGSPLATEFSISSTPQSGSSHPAVGTAPDGQFVVVWESSSGLRARRFSALDTPEGIEFVVTGNVAIRPSIAIGGPGFVVVWSDGDVRGRQFSLSGAALGPEFVANSFTPDVQDLPVVRSEPDGDFVVVWQSLDLSPPMDAQDGSYGGVFGQRFASSGARIGVEFQVNAYTPGYQSGPALLVGPDGRFLVTWATGDGSYSGITAQRFDSSGVRSGGEFQVNEGPFGNQRYARVAGDGEGRVVGAWESDPPDQDYTVVLRRFASTGTPQSFDVQVNLHTVGEHRRPTVAFGADRFVVAWEAESDGDGTGILAQEFRLISSIDVDGDGLYLPLTDGILLLRFAFGFTGETLIDGAVGAGCTRCDAPSITAHLQSLL